jgi:hypothetical protein
LTRITRIIKLNGFIHCERIDLGCPIEIRRLRWKRYCDPGVSRCAFVPCRVNQVPITRHQILPTRRRMRNGGLLPTLSDLPEGYPGESLTPSLVCPVCAGSSRILHVASNIHPDNPYAFNFRVCSTCSHGWIGPMPTQGLLNHLYARGSRSVIGECGPSQLTIPEQVCVQPK